MTLVWFGGVMVGMALAACLLVNPKAVDSYYWYGIIVVTFVGLGLFFSGIILTGGDWW